MSRASARVPKLDAAVLGARKNPVGVRCQCDGQDEISVTFECFDALPTLGCSALTAPRRAQFPHLDGSVETAADKILAAGREGHGINRIFVTIWAFKTLDQEPSVDVPDAYAFVKRPSRNILSVRRDCDGCDTIFDSQRQSIGALLYIPKTNSPVAAPGCDGSPVTCEIQRINVLLVTGEMVSNGP